MTNRVPIKHRITDEKARNSVLEEIAEIESIKAKYNDDDHNGAIAQFCFQYLEEYMKEKFNLTDEEIKDYMSEKKNTSLTYNTY